MTSSAIWRARARSSSALLDWASALLESASNQSRGTGRLRTGKRLLCRLHISQVSACGTTIGAHASPNLALVKESRSEIGALTRSTVHIYRLDFHSTSRVCIDVTIDVLQYIESTEVGQKLPDITNKCGSWDIERLDREGEERTTGEDGERGEAGCVITTGT
jgi:hypothetical protein